MKLSIRSVRFDAPAASQSTLRGELSGGVGRRDAVVRAHGLPALRLTLDERVRHSYVLRQRKLQSNYSAQELLACWLMDRPLALPCVGTWSSSSLCDAISDRLQASGS